MSSNVRWKAILTALGALIGLLPASSQPDTLGFWEVPGDFHRGRFWTAAGTGTVAYAGALISLNQLWYKQYERTSFHLFDDASEWQQMDKAGHMFTAYFEADWSYHIARWTGMKESSAIWTGALLASGLQATVEMLDGFSSKWGFSVYDFGSNLTGSAFWAGQQAIWKEQRIQLKVSSTYRSYPDDVLAGFPQGSTTLRTRTDDLFGKNIFQSFLKDYNAQTIWASVNIHSFLKEETPFPKWLNIAVGYSAENMFGGFENTWEVDGNTYATNKDQFPRFRQWYISPDIDLSRIHVKSKLLKVLLGMANVFKIPAPALEINGQGGVRWKWLHY